MTGKWMNYVSGAGLLVNLALSTGCGEYVRESRSPSQLVIMTLEGASGAEPNEFGGTLRSDVSTLIERDDDLGGNYYSVYNDIGKVKLRAQLRDPGPAGVATTPSDINAVTITRYRVAFRRADGRNTPGVDVPYPFDSGLTLTIPAATTAEAGFDLVRHVAKLEAPLKALTNSSVFITTIADITFYGHDQAGNELSVTGSIGITFGDFADPE